jgi:hypothetical protein
MRRVAPNAQHATTGILLAFAVAGVGAAAPDPERVKVTLVLSGDVGQYAGMCAGLGGWDSLTGVLVRDGTGPVAPDEDLMYRGPLSRKTSVGACGTKPAPTEDQVAMCTATLTGSAKMNVELEVYEGDRGAYIKMEADTTSPVTESVGGCVEPSEWLKDYYPNGASGISISTVPSGLLQVTDTTTYTDSGVSLTVFPR